MDGVYEPRVAIGRTAKLCRDARAAVGEEVVLGHEWHHRLSVAEAASFCQKLPAGTLDWVALSLYTTAHSFHTRFTNIFGNSVSEATMRPNPRHARLGRVVALYHRSLLSYQIH